jgi:hypothetical protein
VATPITVRVASGGPLDPHVVARSVFEIAPPLTFATPATLVLQFDPAQGPSGAAVPELTVHALPSAASSWQAVAGASTAANEASAPILSTGVYGVRWSGPSAPCANAEDDQFDFWLGTWDFSAPNTFPGTNDITREGGGCLIEEHFVDSSGTRGRSVSLHSRVDGRWHQTYVDTHGMRLVLVGAFDGNRMVLNQDATLRFVWQALDPDTVRYFEERSTDGQTWTVGFDSRYTRR